jgi:type II secretory pathway component PulJ
LMIALVAGLIVSGAVLAFTMSSLNSNTEYVASTRLTQELRSTIDYISRELRRAGYDESAIEFYSQPANASPIKTSAFSALQVDSPSTNDGCVVYAYDRKDPSSPGGTPDLAQGEIRAFRRAQATIKGQLVGVIEIAESAAGLTPGCGGDQPDYTTYPATCNTGSGWCALTDPRVIDVTGLVVDDARNITVAAVPNGTPLYIRSLGVTINGHLVTNPNVSRTVATRIRVRADCLRTPSQCNVAPSGI